VVSTNDCKLSEKACFHELREWFAAHTSGRCVELSLKLACLGFVCLPARYWASCPTDDASVGLCAIQVNHTCVAMDSLRSVGVYGLSSLCDNCILSVARTLQENVRKYKSFQHGLNRKLDL
jgi:hypothetical protein